MKIKKIDLRYNDTIGKKRDRLGWTFYKEISVLNPDGASGKHQTLSDPFCIFRFYSCHINDSPYHCIAWFYGAKSFANRYGSGYGFADGCGYCRESMAMDLAIADAGIILETPFGGVGETAMRTAALAIGKKLSGKRKVILHFAHQ